MSSPGPPGCRMLQVLKAPRVDRTRPQKINPLGSTKYRNGEHMVTERAPELHTVESLKDCSEQSWLVPALLWSSPTALTQPCFQPLLEAGGLDRWVDGWMDGRTDGWTDGWMDGWTDLSPCQDLQPGQQCEMFL